MRRSSLPLALGTACCLLAGGSLPRTYGQAGMPMPEKVHFETVDQVDIEGTFYPSKMNGRKAPTVILLHKLGGNSHQDNWEGVAKALQKVGCAVLAFDFRGHGRSTSVGAAFWEAPYNNVRNIRVKKVGGKMPSTINRADFNPAYIPYLTNDISAARMYLERRNDASECNVSNLVLVGAEEGATLGALWLAAECDRYRLLLGGVGGARLNAKPESKDVVACFWVGMSQTLGKNNNVSQPLKKWLIRAGKDEKIPMGFLYGEKNRLGDSAALKYVHYIKPRYQRPKPNEKPKPGDNLPATADFRVKNTSLTGSKLLADTFETPTFISDGYLKKKIFEKGSGNEWEKRESEKDPFMWKFGMGRPIQAKRRADKNLEPLPLGYLFK